LGCIGYTAFGSGVSTEILIASLILTLSCLLHSLRLRGEH